MKFNRIFSGLLLCILLICNAAFAQDYDLQPGVHTYRDMKRVLGEPLKSQITPDGINYHFDGIVVNISGNDLSTINTVSYLKPNIYRKYPSLDVGVTVSLIRSQLRDFYEHKDTGYHFITDYEKSVIFWIERDKVIKMVQARSGSLKRLRR